MTSSSRLLAGPLDEDVQRWLKAGSDWKLPSGEQERIWQSIAAEAGSVAAVLAVAEIASKATQVVATAGGSAGSGLSTAAGVVSVGTGSAKLALLVVALKAVGVGLGIGAGLLVGSNAVKSHYIDRPAATAPTLAATSVDLVERSATRSAQLKTSSSAPAERADRLPQPSEPVVTQTSQLARGALRAAEPPAVTQPVQDATPSATTRRALNSMPSTVKQTLPSTLSSASRDTVREESRLVSTVRSALRQGRAASALALLSELDQHYPSGLLGEERAVLRIEALVLDGQSGEASRRAERFIMRYPTSLNLGHVREMVGSSRRGEQ